MTLHFSIRTSPPSQIIAQSASAWNKSAEQEKQFDMRFVGVRVTTSSSVMIKRNGQKR